MCSSDLSTSSPISSPGRNPVRIRRKSERLMDESSKKYENLSSYLLSNSNLNSNVHNIVESEGLSSTNNLMIIIPPGKETKFVSSNIPQLNLAEFSSVKCFTSEESLGIFFLEEFGWEFFEESSSSLEEFGAECSFVLDEFAEEFG